MVFRTAGVSARSLLRATRLMIMSGRDARGPREHEKTRRK